MDQHRFDALTRLLSAKESRRGALGALLTAILLGQHADPLAARKKGKGSGHDRGGKHNQRRRKRRGRGKDGDGGAGSSSGSCCGTRSCSVPKPGSTRGDCDFAGLSLAGGDYHGSTLRRIDGRGTSFDNTDLHGATFGEACLTGASFREANLRGTTWGEACLVDADFADAVLGDATTFADAIFCRTTMPDGSVNDRDCDRPRDCCAACRETGERCAEEDDRPCCAGAECRAGECVPRVGEGECPAPNVVCDGTCCPPGSVCCNDRCGDCCGSDTSRCPAAASPCQILSCDTFGNCTYTAVDNGTNPGNGCPSPQTCCNGNCADIQRDPNSCGPDCLLCTQGPCVNGQCTCVSSTCQQTGQQCGQLPTCDGGFLNCGSCPCPTCTPFETDCVGGQCACPFDVTCQNQGRNCGVLDNRCGVTLNCGACAQGQICCNGVCRSGTCCEDVDCAPTGNECNAGICRCNADDGDQPPCDANGAFPTCCSGGGLFEGCTNRNVDPRNCGGCGNVCPDVSFGACQAGQCVGPCRSLGEACATADPCCPGLTCTPNTSGTPTCQASCQSDVQCRQLFGDFELTCGTSPLCGPSGARCCRPKPCTSSADCDVGLIECCGAGSNAVCCVGLIQACAGQQCVSVLPGAG